MTGRSGTIGCMVLLLLAFGCSSADVGMGVGEDTDGPLMVRMIPEATVYEAGDRLTVAVTIANGLNVGSVPFHLMYDPAVLEFIAPATEGPYLASDGGLTVFLASVVGGGGEIVVGLSRLGEPIGVNGSGTLAVFEFEALAPGNCGFGFTSASVRDPDAVDLGAEFAVVPARVE